MNTIHDVQIDCTKLKELRGQTPAAVIARSLGISRQLFYLYEKGERTMPAPLFVRLCVLYGVDLKDVCTGLCKAARKKAG